MSIELQMEKKCNLELQAQLSEANRLYEELSVRYQTEVLSVCEQAVPFQQAAMELQKRVSEEKFKQDHPTNQITTLSTKNKSSL